MQTDTAMGNFSHSWAAVLLAITLSVGGCAFSVAPTSSEDNELSLELASYPARISIEDSTATAEVWATVRAGGEPVKDNTIVKFATTVGTITSESQTVDGLAVAILTSPGDNRPRQAEIVAQAVTIRDTIDVDFIITAQDDF
ncbi:MAG: hypothetical protein QF689_01170 [Candidatus Latescibacteria bacterium]|nr:hypothetical protein [Candidatus Latescibacterota bacterium]MDP7447172.1 hypothetical protein [Candidatus Latescibacterota bacterium]HJP32126.1 hypothetical protein [Candidatus Latescibacterota bacterium]